MKTKIQKWLNKIAPAYFANPSLEKKVSIGNAQDALSEENVNIGNTQCTLSEVATDEIKMCPNCGIKNNIPAEKSLFQAKCGKCKQSLNQVNKEAFSPATESFRDKLKRVAKEREAQERLLAKRQADWEAMRASKEQADKEVLEARRASKERAEQAEREARQAVKEQAEKAEQVVREKERAKQELFDRNKDLIKKFLEIAERKVSIIDDYGDENWEVLPGEILICLKKITQREEENIDWKRSLPDEYIWLRSNLDKAFRAYHNEHQSKSSTRNALHNMSGIEFEAWVVKVLKENGFNDVRGTPATGDQGADIIAKKGGRNIIIQAKRYKGTVGNKAVQEVIGALQYYDGNEGWVITNSIFSSSAIALAQKCKIKLIDGNALSRIQEFIK